MIIAAAALLSVYIGFIHGCIPSIYMLLRWITHLKINDTIVFYASSQCRQFFSPVRIRLHILATEIQRIYQTTHLPEFLPLPIVSISHCIFFGSGSYVPAMVKSKAFLYQMHDTFTWSLLLVLHCLLLLFSFRHHQSSNQRDRPTNETTTTTTAKHTNKQPRITAREMKRNETKHAYRETSQNPITHTHTQCV